jgi:hypothetical protein
MATCISEPVASRMIEGELFPEKQLGQVFKCDAFDGIRKIDSKTIDLCILDPNYQDWDTLINEGIIELVMDKVKDDGNILAFSRQPFDYQVATKIRPFHRRTFIWSFTNGGAWVSKRLPLVSFQTIFWFSKSKNSFIDVRTGLSYADKTKATKRKSKIFGGWKSEGKDFNPSGEGTWLRDHYHFNKPNTGEVPSKPHELSRIFVKCFCPEGGTLLDPFAGSGTFCKTAQEINRKFIGFERDEKFFIKNNEVILWQP